MTLDFCPSCGGALLPRNQTHYHCVNGHDYYNNPRAAVMLIFINDRDELLFAHRARDPQAGKYDFPGGFVDYGEAATQAALRELKEEAGVTTTSDQLQLIGTVSNTYDRNITTVDLVYVCHHWQGEIHAQDDVAAFEWQALDFMLSPAFAWPGTHSEQLYEVLSSHLATLKQSA